MCIGITNNKEELLDLEARKYAYTLCGPSPCDGCKKDCYGCIDGIAYEHDFDMYKTEYLNTKNL